MYSTSFTWIWRYVFELISYLEKNDTKNEYVLFFNEPHFSLYNCTNSNFKKVLVWARHYSFAEQTIFLYKLYKEKLDLMHFTHFNAPIFYFRPSVVTIHDLTLSFYPGKKMTNILHRLAYWITIKSITRKAKKIIAVSKHTKKDIIEALNISEDKIVVIYEWINKNDFHKIEDKSEIDKIKLKYNIKNNYILYVWVLREHKNILRLVKSYWELLKEWINFDLVIIGKEDYTTFDVRNAIIEQNIKKNVHLLWYIPDKELNIFYSWALAFVFPSLYEWFWLPILESMVLWIPVACSNLSSLPEVAGQDGAVYFNPLSIESIKQSIKEITENESLRQNLIKNWYKRIDLFSWEKMGKEILEIYTNLKI